jgi:hypothetical protein
MELIWATRAGGRTVECLAAGLAELIQFRPVVSDRSEPRHGTDLAIVRDLSPVVWNHGTELIRATRRDVSRSRRSQSCLAAPQPCQDSISIQAFTRPRSRVG